MASVDVYRRIFNRTQDPDVDVVADDAFSKANFKDFFGGEWLKDPDNVKKLTFNDVLTDFWSKNTLLNEDRKTDQPQAKAQMKLLGTPSTSFALQMEAGFKQPTRMRIGSTSISDLSLSLPEVVRVLNTLSRTITRNLGLSA
jgi:hypothetical protein